MAEIQAFLRLFARTPVFAGGAREGLFCVSAKIPLVLSNLTVRGGILVILKSKLKGCAFLYFGMIRIRINDPNGASKEAENPCSERIHRFL